MNKHIRLKLLTFTALMSVIGGLQAGGLDIKPGLWEVQNKTVVNGKELPDMQKMMANVPPEMRAQMQSMMAKNGAGITDKGMTICITPEQIAHGELGNQDPKSHCKMTDLQQAGDKTTMKMHCDNSGADGKTEVTRISDSQWKSMSQMHTDKGDINNESTGKWLKADCGNVRPPGQK